MSPVITATLSNICSPRTAPIAISVEVDPGIQLTRTALHFDQDCGILGTHGNRAKCHAIFVRTIGIGRGRMRAVELRVTHRAQGRSDRLMPRTVFSHRRRIKFRCVAKVSRIIIDDRVSRRWLRDTNNPIAGKVRHRKADRLVVLSKCLAKHFERYWLDRCANLEIHCHRPSRKVASSAGGTIREDRVHSSGEIGDAGPRNHNYVCRIRDVPFSSAE